MHQRMNTRRRSRVSIERWSVVMRTEILSNSTLRAGVVGASRMVERY